MTAEQIARGLAEPERLAILRQSATHQKWRDHFVWMASGRKLLAKGIIAFNPNPRRSDTYFTPLGLEVRAILEAQSHA